MRTQVCYGDRTMPSSGPSSLQSPRTLPLIGPRTALFLDFDGTLVDLAAQPEAVRVTPDVIPTLQRLAARLSGALAIVSGRRLADLDSLLAPLQLPVAAEHGAQRRLASGEIVQSAAPDLHEVIRRLDVLARCHRGLRLEVKAAAVALHYRHAPELEAVCLQAMTDALSVTSGVELLRGKCVLEIKPAGIDKGSAIAAFMARAPFAGRSPLFAGDDVTDEAGFAVTQQLGGCGIKVGEGATQAVCHCASPAALRQWLQSACRALVPPHAGSPVPEPSGRINP
jgi:trehalose 6-phosphate phosphatase